MGASMSSPGGADVSDCDRTMHREAEKALKDAKAKMALQVKVLLLGSGDSGKSTILKQMRLIHRAPFSLQETESFRQLVFINLTNGLKAVFDAMLDMGLEMKVEDEQVKADMELIEGAEDLGDGEPFPERGCGRTRSCRRPWRTTFRTCRGCSRRRMCRRTRISSMHGRAPEEETKAPENCMKFVFLKAPGCRVSGKYRKWARDAPSRQINGVEASQSRTERDSPKVSRSL
ncbi:G-protein alpha subunit-domain-containing protein [Mycena rebaudengoi]|nr:G-protein alpha subunit-domain-containing protein [Mycena rebaudengoi]